MKESILKEKSKAFALHVIKTCKAIKGEAVLANQLLRSGTSIGANIHEAQFAHGKADFIAKLQIALKECAETEYWIELISESGKLTDNELSNECVELKRLLISSITTAKNNE